jgi:hypothetical protein
VSVVALTVGWVVMISPGSECWTTARRLSGS